MIPHTLQVTLSIAVICYFIIILYYLKRKMLELKYTLIWLVAGVVMGIMIYFPELTVWFVHLIGMQDNMNGLYNMCLAFMMMILMTLTKLYKKLKIEDIMLLGVIRLLNIGYICIFIIVILRYTDTSGMRS